MGPTFLGKKPLPVPEPRQKVRLRAGRGPWRGNFRAVSYPYTDEAGEVVIRVARESEYHDALMEGRRAIGMPWPVRQVEVVSFPEDGEKTQELPQSAAAGSTRGDDVPQDQERTEERPWWRRVFGG
jgi:hypothetical protein